MIYVLGYGEDIICAAYQNVRALGYQSKYDTKYIDGGGVARVVATRWEDIGNEQKIDKEDQ